MKKILLLAIVFHSFCYSANAMILESASEFSPLVTHDWLKAVLGEKIEGMLSQQSAARQDAFWNAWNKSAPQVVRDLTANRSLSAQQQSLMILIDKVLKEETLEGAIEKIAAEMLKKTTASSAGNENFNRDLAESKSDVYFYKIMLASLISDKKFEDASESEINFYQEILEDMNDGKPIITKIMEKFLYLGRFRSFGTFVEVNFLKKKDTNELIATRKSIGMRPDSIQFCIAEILRSDLFRTMSNSLVRRDQATANPLAMPSAFFGDFEKKDYLEHIERVLSALKQYENSKITKFSDEEMEKMIQKTMSEHKSLCAESRPLPCDRNLCIKYIKDHVERRIYSKKIGNRLIELSLRPVLAKRQTEADPYPSYFITRLINFGDKVINEKEIDFSMTWEMFKKDIGLPSLFK